MGVTIRKSDLPVLRDIFLILRPPARPRLSTRVFAVSSRTPFLSCDTPCSGLPCLCERDDAVRPRAVSPSGRRWPPSERAERLRLGLWSDDVPVPLHVAAMSAK